jgi:hypothetical protein
MGILITTRKSRTPQPSLSRLLALQSRDKFECAPSGDWNACPGVDTVWNSRADRALIDRFKDCATAGPYIEPAAAVAWAALNSRIRQRSSG